MQLNLLRIFVRKLPLVLATCQLHPFCGQRYAGLYHRHGHSEMQWCEAAGRGWCSWPKALFQLAAASTANSKAET